ncbi:sugar ABC transporter substrate-binding protein [Streptomyces sp. SID7909]|uniref:ABC transporter substrate-binding protein n=1 Tax=Streptomyces sp. SID7909 TaxID=2706092 RepID=UPI0013B94BB9|nr:sugar ABC transporter substrate-binding protein [Streptomyces sp. SID7909]NEC04196.1 sugar ABC transporter substrate-binding protein [Streptomyces sp. SID7909]
MRALVRTAAAAATALALLLTGCGGNGDGEADGKVTLRFQSLAWQKESVDINKQLVKEWNAAHPDIRVEYVQGSWDSVHDQLLTSFEGGEAPDIIHDASDDLADFAYGGYLADLRPLLPKGLTDGIPHNSWETATFDGGVYGVPFLQEPRVLIANTKILKASGVRIPTPEKPWSWTEFRQVTKELSGAGRYGVAWPLKEPVSVTLNLGLSAGGELFHRGVDGKVTVAMGEGDQVVPDTIHDQVNTDHSAARTALGMGGGDTLPGFFGGKYAMVPLGFSYRQQIVEQAPKGFEWTVLPAPAGRDGLAQGVSPQTLSVAEDSPHKKEAVEFIDFLLRPANMVRLAKGDWMLPTGTEALADPSLHTADRGWATGAALAASLRSAPAQSVRGYPEWKDKVATPALQEYYSGAIDAAELKKRLVTDGNRVLARYQR